MAMIAGSTGNGDPSDNEVLTPKHYGGLSKELLALQANRPADILPRKRTRKPVAHFKLTAEPIDPQGREIVRKPISIRKQSMRLSKSGKNGLECCKEILTNLVSAHHECSWPFHHPVQTSEAPDYHSIIKNPMDLTTIREKLNGMDYESMMDFVADVRLMFINCYNYNSPEHDVFRLGKKLNEIFEYYIRKVPTVFLNDDGTYFRNNPEPDVLLTTASSGKRKWPGYESETDCEPDDLGYFRTSLENVRAHKTKSELERMLKAEALERKQAAKKPKVVAFDVQSLTAASTSSVAVRVTAGYDSDAEDEVVSLSKDEVRQLTLDVSKQPAERLIQIVDIVHRCEPPPPMDPRSDEISIDFDTLKDSTVRQVQAFLNQPVGRVKPIRRQKPGNQNPKQKKHSLGSFEEKLQSPASETHDQDSGNFSVSASDSSSDSGSDSSAI